jgi:hypothetical protein
MPRQLGDLFQSWSGRRVGVDDVLSDERHYTRRKFGRHATPAR